MTIKEQRDTLLEALRKSNWQHIAPRCGLKADEAEVFKMIEEHKKVISNVDRLKEQE